MKKIQIIFLFVFLVGCSSSSIVPSTAILDIVQTPTPLPTQTAIPPTQTLTPTATATFTPTITPTVIGGGMGKIAFTSEQDGFPEIYMVNSNGSNLIKLKNNISPKFYPAWSPDGKKIAFGTNNDESASLYIMNADGSNPAKLIDTTELGAYSQATSDWRLFSIGNPVWSPNGMKIAFRAGHYVGCCKVVSNINVINADGSNLISTKPRYPWNDSAAWSPNSQKIAFHFDNTGSGGSSIVVMNADGTDLHLINENGSGPIWSPDGEKIAFSPHWYGNFEIGVMNADGTNPINITPYLSGWGGSPSWSPDGKKIVFVSSSDGDNEIYVINSDGTNLINLTNNQAADDNPVWSPDSQKIAFVSERDGNQEIYVMNADGTNPINLTNSDTKDYSPVWSP